MWSPRDKRWEPLPSGIDPTLIRANLDLTPTARIEKVIEMVALSRDLQAAVRRAQGR